MITEIKASQEALKAGQKELKDRIEASLKEFKEDSESVRKGTER